MKDRRMGVIRLDGEVCGSCSEKHLWSAEERNQKLVGNRWTGGWELLQLHLV